MQHLLGLARRAIDDYDMIREGDNILVGVSGGKDSLTVLCLLARLRDFYPKKFTLHAATIDMGFGQDFSPIEELCAGLGVPYTVKRTDIYDIIFNRRREKNPCSLCSKMRRGAIDNLALSLGCSRVALGHHMDDAVETYLMSLLYEGRFHCFSPVTYLTRCGLYQIRPMIYISEAAAAAFSQREGLPVIKNPCPADGSSKRRYVKDLLRRLCAENPAFRQRIFTALQRSDIEQWKNPHPFVPFMNRSKGGRPL